MIKACIFDLDGVLVDTARYHYLAWNRLAAGLGFEFTPKDNERLKGVSRMESLDILLQIGNMTLSDPEKQILARQKNIWYLEFVDKMSPDDLLPGTREFIALIKDAGIRTGLGTASRNANLILDRTKITMLFDAIVDGNRVTHTKPDPEAFLVCAGDLGLPPRECLVFEDAIAGVQAAHLAGMKVIGVGEPSVLREADRVIAGFIDADLRLIDF